LEIELLAQLDVNIREENMRFLKRKTILLVFVVGILFYLYRHYEPKVWQKFSENIHSCGRFPTEKDIAIDNVIWQVAEHPKASIKILNAYLDLRQKSVVRINVSSKPLDNTTELYCQFWDETGKQLSVVHVTEIIQMRREKF
jgi:hypothetical protein